MEDDEGERKTKTISFTVTEDGFDVDEQAILDALIDREIESRNGDCSRPEALSEVLFTAVITLGELFLGEDRVDEIMDEAFERKRELEKAAVGPPRPPEL
ncbi:MAG: hypothetical protein JAZ18_01900 [Candidatus Thiodiazotropha endolucinida]|nr:hypothetical protein [Candidatus Thiodiazotropha endolucinida]